jgi:hypothetical protein
MADIAIAIAGVVAPIVIGFAADSPLLGATVFLAVTAALLLWAGTRVDSELHGDSGIRLIPETDGLRFRLGVTNDSGQWAKFRADVIAVTPKPQRPAELPWPIPWADTPEREQKIGPRQTQYLHLAAIPRRGQITPALPSGRITFPAAEDKSIVFRGDVYITVTVQASRVDSSYSTKGTFSVWRDDEGRLTVAAAQPALTGTVTQGEGRE